MRLRIAAVVLVAAALGTSCDAGAPDSRPLPTQTGRASVHLCPTNGATERLRGRFEMPVHRDDPAPGTVYDAREATFAASPAADLYPFALGSRRAVHGVCVLGGLVLGGQSRDLTWSQMKERFDGDGLRIAGNGWYAVDGLRVDNVSDGVAPRGTKDRYPADGDGFEFRNLYFTYIRDDCVENDEIAAGRIVDSLFDGCYTGVSERPSSDSPQWRHPAAPTEALELDGVLLRLQAMPGPRGTDASTMGHGQLFKWSEVANRLIVRRSVFAVEARPNSDSAFPFPEGTRTQDVTIVWLGPGPFDWPTPPGTTVTTDRTVWETARARWLERHACTAFTACAKLHDPEPMP